MPENLREPHDRDHAGSDQVGQDRAGADRGKLIDVAHQNDAGFAGDGPQELMAQDDIDHRHFIEHEQIAAERMLLVLLEFSRGRIELQQSVDGLGRAVRGLRQAFGRPARGSRQHALHFFGGKDFEDAADQRGFAHARPARDDQHFVLARLPNGFLLARRQLNAQSLFDPGNRFVHVDAWQGMRLGRGNPKRRTCAKPTSARWRLAR